VGRCCGRIGVARIDLGAEVLEFENVRAQMSFENVRAQM
jgi:hypothetical protein